MPQPNKIPLAFAASGDKNVIPESTETTGLASWREGFPAITSAPFSEGGIAPKRADFNGIFNALSQAVMWMQQGGVYVYDVNTDYEAGNVVIDAGGLYVAKAANGPSSAVVQPSSDTTGATWKPVRLNLATQTAAGYMSAADKKKLDDIDIFVESGSTAASGLVPKPSTTPGTSQYLCEDATWKVPPFVPKGNSTVTITYDPQNVDNSFTTAFKANGVYYISFTSHLKSGLATWTDYWIAHLDITGGAPLRTFFTLTSQSNGLSVPCICEPDGNITLTQKGVNFADDWLWGVAVVPINM